MLVALAACGVPGIAQKPAAPKPANIDGVTLDRCKVLVWRPEDNQFHSPGSVRIRLTDTLAGETTTILADDAEGSPASEIRVRGNLRLERKEGLLLGRALVYHPDDGTGTIADATANASGLILRGDRIDMLTGRSLRAVNASFTTCTLDHPEYHISAREVRLDPTTGRVVAKNLNFWLGNVRLLSLPSMSRNFRQGVTNPIPLPSYTKENGVQIHLRDELLSSPADLLSYDAAISLRKVPQGYLAYECDLGHTPTDAASPRGRLDTLAQPLRGALEPNPALLPETGTGDVGPRRTTFYALAASRLYAENKKRVDMQVSRLPEVGVRWYNLENRPALEAAGSTRYPQVASALGRAFLSPANWLMDAEASVGYFRENPSDEETTRLGTRADAISPLFAIAGPVYLRYGATFWGNAYGNGNLYGLLAPEVEMDALLRPNTMIGAAYRYMQDFGHTPFLFDARDVRHELRLKYAFTGTRWAYDLGVNFDLERKRAYDTMFSFRRRFDCMEVGLGYRTRSQSLAIILNLLPGKVQAQTQTAQ